MIHDPNYKGAEHELYEAVNAGYIDTDAAQDLWELFLEESKEHDTSYALHALRSSIEDLKTDEN